MTHIHTHTHTHSLPQQQRSHGERLIAKRLRQCATAVCACVCVCVCVCSAELGELHNQVALLTLVEGDVETAAGHAATALDITRKYVYAHTLACVRFPCYRDACS